MASILEAICIFCMFLVGVLFPLGILIYLAVIFIKDEIEINRLIKKSGQKHLARAEIKGGRMIYADDLEENHIQDNTGEWHIAKPIEDSSFFRRLIDAWRVLKGECLAVKFWSLN